MQSVLDRAIEAYRRERFLRDANADFAALKKDRKAWRDELAERKLWERTLGDGLDDERARDKPPAVRSGTWISTRPEDASRRVTVRR